MNVLPGEPIPPGFENEINRVADIQKSIQNCKGYPLIGLEYTVELHEDGREPVYMCILCDKRGDPRTIMQHWLSFRHRLQYLEKHYPTAIRVLEPVRNKMEKMKNMVHGLCEAIERHHGRLTPSVANADDFRRLRTKWFEDIKGKFHYDERNGPNFVNTIDRAYLQTGDPKRIESISKQSTQGLDEISSDSDGGANSNKKSKQSEQAPAYRFVPYNKQSQGSSEKNSAEKGREKEFPTPNELSLQASQITQERYKWEKYHCMLDIQLKQMEVLQKEYEKVPENHPLYPEEWKTFWNRRYKELQKEKKVDPNKHDYRPEWAVFWSKRKKELYEIEVEKKKKEIKAKLELPEDAVEMKVDKPKEKPKIPFPRTHVPEVTMPAARERTDVPIINISDEDSPQRPSRTDHSSARSRPTRRHSRSISPRSRYDSKRPRMRNNSRSISPFSDDYDDYENRRRYVRLSTIRGHRTIPQVLALSRRYPPPEEADYYDSALTQAHYSTRIHPVHEPYPPHKKYVEMRRTSSMSPRQKSLEIEPEIEEGELTVIAVLRLLTALEDTLGSLGPKMVDLLGKALALENVKANSSDELLMNDDNCVFFETAKEKLKGLLIADVIDDQQKVQAVKKAIKHIAAIIHQVSAKGKSAEKKEDVPVTASQSSNKAKKIVKELPFDRQIVASKLAAALVLQGREDLSTEDMDKLIHFFILMVKLWKGKFEVDEKPLHINDIADELGLAKAHLSSKLFSLSKSAKPTLPNFVEDLFDEKNRRVVTPSTSTDTVAKTDAGSSLESLTDSDLQTLLQNFKHLSTEEQHHLIAHLKKLETANPTRVENLRKYVNVGDLADSMNTNDSGSQSVQRTRNDASSSTTASNRNSTSKNLDDNSSHRSFGRERINSDNDDDDSRQRGTNVVNPNKFSLDDEDDDDYNFDEVLKAASSIVDGNKSHQSKGTDQNKKQAIEPMAPGTSKSSQDTLTFNRAAMNVILGDTQNLIDNLMGSIQQNNSAKSSSMNSAPQPVPSLGHAQQPPAQQSSMQFYQQADQHYPQQYQQQQPQHPYGGPGDYNQMGYNQYSGPDQSNYYNNQPMGGYNNGYQGYPNQGQQQWMHGQHQQHRTDYNMYNRH